MGSVLLPAPGYNLLPLLAPLQCYQPLLLEEACFYSRISDIYGYGAHQARKIKSMLYLFKCPF